MERGPALLTIVVHGQAAPAGSKTADPVMRELPGGERVPVIDPATGKPKFRQRHAGESTKPWMNTVAQQAAYTWGCKPLLEGPVWIEVVCFEPRPKSHFRSGQFAHLLKPDAPAYPHITRTGDSDKLRRAIQDALTGVVYRDDKLVVSGDDWKAYGEKAKASIRVGLMKELTAVDLGLAEPVDPAGQETLLAA